MAETQGSRFGFVITYLCIIGLGVGSWLAINGLWAELPVLSQISPDGPDLQSILNYAIQMANIGPLTYLLFDLVCLNVAKKKINKDNFLVVAICLVIVIGVVACVALAFAHTSTTMIGGKEHSLALIILSFMLALVDCTSTVTFIPYMERFNSFKFMTALYIGEGLSGVFPSVFALIQGVNIPHGGSGNGTSNTTQDLFATPSNSTASLHLNFSAEVYFFLLTGLLVLCGFSFGMLQVLPQANQFKKTRSKPASSPEPKERASRESDEQHMQDSPSAQCSDTDPLIFGTTEPVLTLSQKCGQIFCCENPLRQTPLYLMQGVVNYLANGAINTVSYFAFACYGPLTYLLAINLGMLVNPIASFVALFFPLLSIVGLVVMFALTTLLCVLLVVFGFLGLTFHLPFLGTIGGSVFVVSVDRPACGCDLGEGYVRTR